MSKRGREQRQGNFSASLASIKLDKSAGVSDLPMFETFANQIFVSDQHCTGSEFLFHTVLTARIAEAALIYEMYHIFHQLLETVHHSFSSVRES